MAGKDNGSGPSMKRWRPIRLKTKATSDIRDAVHEPFLTRRQQHRRPLDLGRLLPKERKNGQNKTFFRDDAHLCYLYEGEKTGKRGRPRVIDGKIDYKHLDKSRMQLLSIEGLMGKAYTLLAYSKSLKCKVRLVIWQMPDGAHFLSDTNR